MEDSKARQRLTNCAMCADMCKHSCPSYLATGSETLSPQKLARLILYHEKGYLEDTQGFFDVVFRSSMCGACRAHCMYDDHDLREFIMGARRRAFEEGVLPHETRKRVETFREFGNPRGERRRVDRGTGQTGYFVSCSAYQDQDVLGAMERILAAIKEPVREFGGADVCCGAPLFYAGDVEGFAGAAKRMKGHISERGLRTVVADCPTCVRTLRYEYPQAGAGLDIEILHSSEFLLGLIQDGKLKVGPREGTVTFHDPCILANDLDATEAAREVLRRLGLDLREPAYSGRDTHCCGGTVGGKLGDPNVAEKVSSMRVSELRETAADVYVSACSTCKAVLSGAGIKDISELVSEQIVDE